MNAPGWRRFLGPERLARHIYMACPMVSSGGWVRAGIGFSRVCFWPVCSRLLDFAGSCVTGYLRASLSVFGFIVIVLNWLLAVSFYTQSTGFNDPLFFHITQAVWVSRGAPTSSR